MDPEVIGEMDETSRRVVLRREIEAGPAIVWRALTEPAGLAAWLGRYEGPQLGPGVGFVIWHEELVCSSHAVVEWLPSRLVTVSWDFPGEMPSRVRFAVEPSTSGTTVVLEHEGVEDLVGYAAGWHVHLDLLAEYARGHPRSFERFWDDYGEILRCYGSSPR